MKKKSKLNKGTKIKALGVLLLCGGVYVGANFVADVVTHPEQYPEISYLLGKPAEPQKKSYDEKSVKKNYLYQKGKSLDDYFNELDSLSSEEQENLAKSLNKLSSWETILLARYIPIDGIVGKLSSFYSTDYKLHLQIMLSESIMNPTTISSTMDKGLGQLSQSSEEWARELYTHEKSELKFPGKEITENIFDPYTNLILSSIILRKCAEEKVLDKDAEYSLYSNGWVGVRLNEEGYYVTSDSGKDDTTRANSFDSLSEKMVISSWISMKKPELTGYIENKSLRDVLEKNNGDYDSRIAYEGMIDFLKSLNNPDIYSKDDLEMFDEEIQNISEWLKVF